MKLESEKGAASVPTRFQPASSASQRFQTLTAKCGVDDVEHDPRVPLFCSGMHPLSCSQASAVQLASQETSGPTADGI